MSQPSIVFLDRDSLPVPVPVFPFAHAYREISATTPEQIVQHVGDADIVITNKVPFSRETLLQLPG
jgi:glycerate dehydrogenase